MWTATVPTDGELELALLHGVFPMAPSPAGDHSLGMEGMPVYLRYASMWRALRGRMWRRLEAREIRAVRGNLARGGLFANLFEQPCGDLVALVRRAACAFPALATVTPDSKLARHRRTPDGSAGDVGAIEPEHVRDRWRACGRIA